MKNFRKEKRFEKIIFEIQNINLFCLRINYRLMLLNSKNNYPLDRRVFFSSWRRLGAGLKLWKKFKSNKVYNKFEAITLNNDAKITTWANR